MSNFFVCRTSLQKIWGGLLWSLEERGPGWRRKALSVLSCTMCKAIKTREAPATNKGTKPTRWHAERIIVNIQQGVVT